MKLDQNLAVYSILGIVIISVSLLLTGFYFDLNSFGNENNPRQKAGSPQHYMSLGTKYSVDELLSNPELIRIDRVDDEHVHLMPDGKGSKYHCASLTLERLSNEELSSYLERTDPKYKFLNATDGDLAKVPQLRELIAATHQIPFPYNDFVHVNFDGVEFVEYEFFLMEKMMEKYGGNMDDYFMRLSADYEERLTNPKKQGFSNEFSAPRIIYNETVYAVGGTVFWTSDEHNLSMSLHLKDSVEDKKFITLSESDMEQIPKFREGIERIGQKQESITAFKGIPELEWNYYLEWYREEIKNQFGPDNKSQRTSVAGFHYDGDYYNLGFIIC